MFRFKLSPGAKKPIKVCKRRREGRKEGSQAEDEDYQSSCFRSETVQEDRSSPEPPQDQDQSQVLVLKEQMDPELVRPHKTALAF